MLVAKGAEPTPNPSQEGSMGRRFESGVMVLTICVYTVATKGEVAPFTPLDSVHLHIETV